MRDDIRWIAGMLEGEGSFCWNMYLRSDRKGRRYSQAVISMQSTDADVVARVAKFFKQLPQGPYFWARGHQPVYNVQLRGIPALRMMRRLYPYMGARRKATIKWALQARSY